ncbi:hypothetical protein B0T14DRAFT_270708 [Immersiella caudata]|uniref:Uncharacterized protein n=1 Tax=Immersiella caudata TaxID=314043 RepID=A0AA39WL80_9PEZI|nr:hypothetical protein B0T14DRAFT_270708 [Immersiella caudata]
MWGTGIYNPNPQPNPQLVTDFLLWRARPESLLVSTPLEIRANQQPALTQHRSATGALSKPSSSSRPIGYLLRHSQYGAALLDGCSPNLRCPSAPGENAFDLAARCENESPL